MTDEERQRGARAREDEASAAFVRRLEWKVGDLLYGAPTPNEDSVRLRITAIGETEVLGRRWDEVKGYGRESSWSFSGRLWTKTGHRRLGDPPPEVDEVTDRRLDGTEHTWLVQTNAQAALAAASRIVAAAVVPDHFFADGLATTTRNMADNFRKHLDQLGDEK